LVCLRIKFCQLIVSERTGRPISNADLLAKREKAIRVRSSMALETAVEEPLQLLRLPGGALAAVNVHRGLVMANWDEPAAMA
jgi:hypothetical protein